MNPNVLSGKEGKEERVRVSSKPKSCPACGSKRIAAYLYGMPVFSEELKNNLDKGKIILGGCCISEDDPAFKCLECETEIYRTAP